LIPTQPADAEPTGKPGFPLLPKVLRSDTTSKAASPTRKEKEQDHDCSLLALSNAWERSSEFLGLQRKTREADVKV